MITVKKRVMIIPKIEKYIGTLGDSNTESRIFRIDRFSDTQTDLAYLEFKLATVDEEGRQNIIDLVKSVSREYIDLTWTIIGSDIGTPGTLLTQIRAVDIQGMVRWNSFQAAFYAMDNIEYPDVSGRLSDYEMLVTRIAAIRDDIQDGLIDRTLFDDEGYLNIVYRDGHIERWYVKGDPPSEEDIIRAAELLGQDIQELLDAASEATRIAQAAADEARRAAADAEAAARGEKVSETVTFTADMWGESAPYKQTVSDTVLEQKTSSDFISSVVYGFFPSAEKKAYGCIDTIEITSEGVTATCFEKKPEVTINVYLREV